MRSLFALVVFVIGTVLAVPAQAGEEECSTYSGDEFKAMYDYAVAKALPNLMSPAGRLPITGDAALDARIWEIATARGYVPRPVAGRDLDSADGVPMQPQAAAAWLELKAAARAAGHGFVVSSAYRSPESQRTQFNSKLRGTTDEAIDAALTWYSSREHRSTTAGMRSTSATRMGLSASSGTRPITHGWQPRTSTTPSGSGSSPPTPTMSLPKAPTPSPGSSCGWGST